MSRLKTLDFAELFHAKDITTDTMRLAINDWYDLYYSTNISPDEDNSQRLPTAVVSKLYKAIFSEYTAESNNEFANNILQAMGDKKKKAMQQALIGGQCFLKPLIFGESLKYSVISRDNVIILGRDDENRVIDIGMEEDTEIDGRYYTLLERRTAGDKLTIESRLYVSDSRENIGRRIPLQSLAKYEMLQDLIELPVKGIGLIPLTCPAENCIDGSDDPVSVYAAAVGLIHNINHNEYQLNGEFEKGESRIFGSSDLIARDSRGRARLVDDLFVGLDDDPSETGFHIFSPVLREESFLSRKKEYLRNIESLIGLKRGILSDVEAQERTAKEITSSEGDYNLTIIDFQQAWEAALKEACEVTAQLYAAYRLGNNTVNPDDLVINWGNGVLYDRDKTLSEYLTLVSAGLLKPEIATAYYFNIPWKTPADLEKVREEYMPQLAALMEE